MPGNPVLKLFVPTATAEEVERGLAAAVTVFQQARIHPIDAAAAASPARAGTWAASSARSRTADRGSPRLG